MAEDCIITLRVKSKTLANIARYFNSIGQLPKTRSLLLRRSLEVLEESLLAYGKIRSVRSTEQALEELKLFGYPTDMMITNQTRRILAQETIMDDFDGVVWEDSSAIAAIPSLSEIKESLIIKDEEE